MGVTTGHSGGGGADGSLESPASEIEMPQRTEGTKTRGDQVRLPAGVVLKPPVSMEDLTTGTEYDPEGAEEFVAWIRAPAYQAILAGRPLGTLRRHQSGRGSTAKGRPVAFASDYRAVENLTILAASAAI